MTDDDGVFSRWSRRKRKVEMENPTREAVTPEPGQIAEPTTEEEETELLEQLGLPVPETLKDGDDFSDFMKAGVPEFLRKRALRVLWRSNPVLANLDGLNDYDDDFTSPELTKKVLATAYKVGRGILKDPVEADDGVEPDEGPAAETEVAAAEPERSNETSGLETNASEAPRHVFEEQPPEETEPRPRRMRFDSSIPGKPVV